MTFTQKKLVVKTIPILLLFFLWCSGLAWSAPSDFFGYSKIADIIPMVTAPIPSKTGHVRAGTLGKRASERSI